MISTISQIPWPNAMIACVFITAVVVIYCASLMRYTKRDEIDRDRWFDLLDSGEEDETDGPDSATA